MFDEWLRGLKDALLAPLVRRLGWLDPNAITVVALLVGLGAAVLAARGAGAWALAAWLCNRVLDGLDGAVARERGAMSDFGAYLDIIADFVVYAAVPFGVVLGCPEAGLELAALFLVSSFYVNAASWMFLAALLERRGQGAAARGERTSVTMPRGLIAGTETIVFFAIVLAWPATAAMGFWLMGSLVGVNVVMRLVWARRQLPRDRAV